MNERRLIAEAYEGMYREMANYGTGTMTVEQLRDYLLQQRGVTMIHVWFDSPLKLLKKSRATEEAPDRVENPYQGAVKHCEYSGQLGGNYGTMVQNKEIQAHEEDELYEPTFQPQPIWNGKGVRIAPFLVQHNVTGEYYLYLPNPKKLGASSYSMPDGTPLTTEQLAPFFQKQYTGKANQSAVGIATENQVYPKFPKLDHITRIKMGGFDINIT